MIIQKSINTARWIKLFQWRLAEFLGFYDIDKIEYTRHGTSPKRYLVWNVASFFLLEICDLELAISRKQKKIVLLR